MRFQDFQVYRDTVSKKIEKPKKKIMVLHNEKYTLATLYLCFVFEKTRNCVALTGQEYLLFLNFKK